MIVFREGRAEDIPTLHEFSLKLARETEELELDEELLQRGLKALFADPAKGQYYVAEDDGQQEIVGCLSVTFEWSDWRNGTVWWLQNVYVKESYRKNGVFRLMYDNIMKKIHEDPTIKGLRLLANQTNVTAHKTYEKMGMTSDHYKVYELLK